MHKRLLIVGIDPGTTTGYAALDLNGKIVQFDSSKQFDLSALIMELIPVGKILITGCDKGNAPSFVYKTSTKVGARLIVPKKDLLSSEKKKLIDEYKLRHRCELNNDHERDALASALYAYKEVAPLIKKIEKYLKGVEDKSLHNKIITLTLQNNIAPYLAHEIAKKDREPIARIIHRSLKRTPAESQTERGEELSEMYDHIKRMERQIKTLKTHSKNLKQQLAEEKSAHFVTKKKLKSLSTQSNPKKSLILKEKTSRVQQLESQINQHKQSAKDHKKRADTHLKIISQLHRGHIMKRLKNLGFKEYHLKKKHLGFNEGDILYVDDPTIVSPKVVKELKALSVQLVCKQTPPAQLTKRFTCVDAQGLTIIENKDIALVTKASLKKKSLNKGILERVISEYKEKRHK